MDILQLEKPLVELSNKMAQLRTQLQDPASRPEANSAEEKRILAEIMELDKKFDAQAQEIFSGLTSYQITQLSRHPNRPYTLDIIAGLCSDFVELHGDRNFMDDNAIVSGIGIFRGHRVAIVGHQKGRNTKENMKRNFGMPRPEGYRKALRIMSMAERFNLPIFTFIDTPGAYPGIDAEERGQSEAIAKNIMVMSRLSVPVITVVVGEGGSGGALAIGVANKVFMMEYSTYSVISPEGCASILWKDGKQADRAAELLGLTADIALKNGIIDGIIKEPIGGAHWKMAQSITRIGDTLESSLKELMAMNGEELKKARIQKYFGIGGTKTMPAISPFRRDSAPNPRWKESWDDVKKSMKI